MRQRVNTIIFTRAVCGRRATAPIPLRMPHSARAPCDGANTFSSTAGAVRRCQYRYACQASAAVKI